MYCIVLYCIVVPKTIFSIEVDPCALDSTNDCDGANELCIQDFGRIYHCECEAGYNYNSSGYCVIDYTDPCAQDETHHCHDLNEICINDNNGGYHCECKDGFHLDSTGGCTDCSDSTICNQYNYVSNYYDDYKVVCRKIDNKDVCLDLENAEKVDKGEGVLICSEEDLNGVCQILQKMPKEEDIVWYYEQSDLAFEIPEEYGGGSGHPPIEYKTRIKSIKTLSKFETYYIKDIGMIPIEPTEDYVIRLFENSDILNIPESFSHDPYKIIIQPKDYETFTEIYGETKLYVELQHKNSSEEVVLRYVISDIGSYNIGEENNDDLIKNYHLDNIIIKNGDVWALTQGVENDEFYRIEEGEVENNDIIDEIIVEDKEINWDKGLIICLPEFIDNRCFNFINHVILKEGYSSYNNNFSYESIEIDEDGNEIIVDNYIYNFDYLYLHNDGWEAFVCENLNDNFQDCVKIEGGQTIESINELGLTKIEAIYIQPVSDDKFKRFFGQEPYVVIFNEPEYKGNHLIFHGEGKHYNPLKTVSVKKIGDLNVFFNGNKYIHTTDITSYQIDNLSNNHSDILIKSIKDSVTSQGIKLGYNGEELYLMKSYNFSQLSEIKFPNSGDRLVDIKAEDLLELKIKNDWEGYLCFDHNKEECYYFSDKKNWDDDDFDFFEEKKITKIVVQPKTHNKLVDIYGHAEYPFQWGYFEIYPNTCWEDIEYFGNINFTSFENELIKNGFNYANRCMLSFDPELEMNSHSKAEVRYIATDKFNESCEDDEKEYIIRQSTKEKVCYKCNDNTIYKHSSEMCVYDCNNSCKPWEICRGVYSSDGNWEEDGNGNKRTECIKHPGTKQIFIQPINSSLGNSKINSIDIEENSVFENVRAVSFTGNVNFKISFEDDNNRISNNRFYINENWENNKIVSISPISVKPSIAIFDSNDHYSWGLGKGFYKGDNFIPGLLKQYYSPFKRLGCCDIVDIYADIILENYNGIPPNTILSIGELFSEYYLQDKYLDGADLSIILSHGHWNNKEIVENGEIKIEEEYGASVSIKTKGFFQAYSKHITEGAEMGDSDTEWLILNGCQTLGTKKCSKWEYDGHHNKVCTKFYTTKAEVAIKSYIELFVNGLHGIGGHFKNSSRYCIFDNCYEGEGGFFWLNQYGRDYTVGESYVAVDYSTAAGEVRYTGYIGAGKCTGNKSYVHNDHFWSLGVTLDDPDRSFLKENGFCYYSGASGDRYRDFLTVNPEPGDEWIIYKQTDGDSFIETMVLALGNSVEIETDYIISEGKEIYYGYPFSKIRDYYVLVNNISDSFKMDFDFDQNEIERLYGVVNLLYKSLFQNFITEQGYQLGNFSVALMGDQEYSYEGIKSGKARVYEIRYTFDLFKNGHPFFSQNSIMIGINPITEEITSVKIKLDKLVETDEVVDNKTIEEYIDSYQFNEGEIYKIGYILDEDKKYRPAVIIENNDSGEIIEMKLF